MRVELLTIGDELLLGFVVDTNAAHIARRLAGEGIRIVRRGTVPDESEAIQSAVADALARTGAVLTTGGLGPTSDDLTIPSIAALFGRALRLDEAVLETIRQRFRELGYRGEMPPGNRQQAMLPEGATVLANHHGSAPGIWLEDARGFVATLPGVPREMRGMLDDTLLPLLRARRDRRGGPPTVVRSRTLRTTGIGESALAELLGDLAKGLPGLPLAYNPKWEGTDIRFTAVDLPPDEADRRLSEAVSRVRARCAAHVYGEDAADLAEVVLAACRSAGLRVAVAESCTGGLLGGRLTAIAGSSDVFLGGVIAYDNAVKTRELGVPDEMLAAHGAVSGEVAGAMARGIAARFGAEVGIAITGIAGPGGGTAEKPVGTVWIALSLRGTVRALSRRFVGDREEVRLRSTQAALDLVRRELGE